MSWIMEVKIEESWRPVSMTHTNEVYRYATQAEAENMLRICYPEQLRLGEARVREEG